MSIFLLLFIINNTILSFSVILACMKCKSNNREALTPLQVCKQWYFCSSDVISGHFLTSLLPVGNSPSRNARSAIIVIPIVH